MGLYNEKVTNCNGTYMAKATAIFYEEKDEEFTENSFIKEKVLPFLTIKTLLVTLIVIVSFLIILSIFFAKEKQTKKKSLFIYLIVLVLLIFSFIFNAIKESYSVGPSLNKVNNIRIISYTSDSVRLEFNKVKHATLYEVCYKKTSEVGYNCINTNRTVSLIKNLASDTSYNFKIRGLNSNSFGVYSDIKTVRTYKNDSYYSYLSENEKKVYNEVYNGVKSRKKEISVTPDLSVKDFSKVYHYVRSDHPELFYMDVGYYYFYNNQNRVAGIEKYYNSTFKSYASSKGKFDKAVNSIISKAKTYKSDYEKEQYVAYYLAKNVTYDDKAYKKYSKTNNWTSSMALTQSPYSALVNKKTFCAGYSAAFKYIMEKLGIDTYVIGGTGKRFGYSGEHAWNLVKLDDGYYNVDVTWIRKKNGNGMNFVYFNQPKGNFNLAHVRDKFDRVVPNADGNLFLRFNGSNIIDLKNNSDVILRGKSLKLKVKVDRKFTKKSKLKYKSSNSKIIKVNKHGKIKGLRKGKATIKVYTKDGIYSSKTITVKNKVVCSKIGNIYYGKNGKKVRSSIFYKQCNPKCFIRNNVYYNNVGRPVSRDSYYSVCKGKCIVSGNKYYDKSGSMVSKTAYYKSCNPSCKKVGNIYYDKEGIPSSKEKYNVSCFSKNGNFEVTFLSFGKNSYSTSVKAGSLAKEPNLEKREGYFFEGWYIDDSYTKKYDFNSLVYDDFTLYAKWGKKEYNVNFVSNGVIMDTSKVLYNNLVSKPFDPKRENYFFAGWYKDSDFKNKYSFLTPVTQDLTLYAKWVSENTNFYDVTFVPGNGHDPFIVEVENDGFVDKPIVDSNDEELVFDNWYLDSKKHTLYDFDSKITEDIILYGKWTTKDGMDIVTAPDTASRIQIIIVALGVLFIFASLYYVIRKYGIKLKVK